jgi:hypothetical protein
MATNYNAKYQAEMQKYADSKGVSIPSNLVNLYKMMPAGYAASDEISAKSYYANLAQGRPSFKTPQWAVDNYIKDKPAFYSKVLSDVAYTYFSQGANKNLPFLERYIKLAAENGVPVNKTAEIIAASGNRQQQVLAEFNARNSGNGFASIGPINLTGVGNALNSVFGGLGTVVENAYKGVSNTLAKAEDFVKTEVLPNPIFQIAMAYYMPGIASSLAPSLATLGVSATYQTVVANAIVSITAQVAQGVPLEKAIETATINAIVSSGSPKVATELNNVIKSPAITDAIVSAGSSAAKTALNGGSKEDIERNLVGGLLGSATASSTGSTIAGSAVGGGVTGGVLGALTGAASAYSAEELAKEKAAADKLTGTSTDPGIKVAGGDDATALNMASISAKPEMLGKSGETASALTSRVDEGVTIYERTITGKTPDGKEYSYTATYDPSAPVDKQISYTSSGVIKDAQGNVIPTGGGSATASFTRPDFTAAATTGTYTPTIITPVTPVTPTQVSPDQTILDLINPTKETTSTTQSFDEVKAATDAKAALEAKAKADADAKAAADAQAKAAAADAQEKALAEAKAAQEKAAQEKIIADRMAADKAAQEKAAADRIEADRIAAEIQATKDAQAAKEAQVAKDAADKKAAEDAKKAIFDEKTKRLLEFLKEQDAIKSKKTAEAKAQADKLANAKALAEEQARTDREAKLKASIEKAKETERRTLDFLNQPVIDTTSNADAGTGTGVGTDTTTTLPSGSTTGTQTGTGATTDIGTGTSIGTDTSTGNVSTDVITSGVNTGGGTSTTTTGGDSTSTGTGTSTDVGTDTGTDTETGTETTTTTPYKPTIYTYGGTSPDVLANTLNKSFYPRTGTTGSLTSVRGAGEIESKESGKKRKNVWNEESLRLKDALGL